MTENRASRGVIHAGSSDNMGAICLKVVLWPQEITLTAVRVQAEYRNKLKIKWIDTAQAAPFCGALKIL